MPRGHLEPVASNTGVFRSPFARVCAAIHVQYFARSKRRVGQKKAASTILDLSDPTDRVQSFEKVMSFRLCIGVLITPAHMVLHECLLRVFNGEGACHRI